MAKKKKRERSTEKTVKLGKVKEKKQLSKKEQQKVVGGTYGSLMGLILPKPRTY